MQALRLVIASSDEDCIDALCDYFSEHKKREFARVIGISNMEQLNAFLSKNQVDILFTTIDFYEQIKTSPLIKSVTFFKSMAPKQGYEANTFIDARLPANDISEQLIKAYLKSTLSEPEMLNKTVGAQVIGVYSVAGGVGKSTVAQVIASLLSKSEKQTLYLNLELIPSAVSPMDSEMNFSDVLCEALKDQGNLSAMALSAHEKTEQGFFAFNSLSKCLSYSKSFPFCSIKIQFGPFTMISVTLSSSIKGCKMP